LCGLRDDAVSRRARNLLVGMVRRAASGIEKA